MIRLKQINNSIVRVPKVSKEAQKPALGHELFSEPYCNIFISAKKKSGKTLTIFHILKHCLGPNTRLIVFCSTLYKDETWALIRNYFAQKGYDIEGYTSLKEVVYDEQTGKKESIDRLDLILKELEAEAELDALNNDDNDDNSENEKYEMQELWNYVMDANRSSDVDEDSNTYKASQSKYIAPEIIIVLDDLSTELKSSSLIGLLKKNRHYKMKVIISSQYYLDLKPESRKQIDYFILFKSQTLDKLEAVYKDADLSINFKLFLKLYKHATKDPYSFLYIDARHDRFRKNFTHEYILPD